jgi:hypothetical protein
MQTKEQHAEYMRNVYNTRRAAWIEAQGGKCATCGSSSDLEIDHIDPSEKSFEISRVWTRRTDTRETELAKCQVLCAKCHQEKTTAQVAVEHGGGIRGKHGCRCDKCRLATNKYLRNLKRERRARGLKD